jgi:hypothetical protein
VTCLGFIGGSVWHFFGGIRNAPAGKKLELAWSRVTTRAPILGGLIVFYRNFILFVGSFAVWGTLFSACDCTLTHYRKKVKFICQCKQFILLTGRPLECYSGWWTHWWYFSCSGWSQSSSKECRNWQCDLGLD